MKIKGILIAVLFVSTISGCSKPNDKVTVSPTTDTEEMIGASAPQEDSVLKVELEQRQGNVGGPDFYIGWINITGMSDEIEVQNIVVNRGNCQVVSSYLNNKRVNLPATVKFGELLEVQIDIGCNIVEATVSTSKGDNNYSFDS